MAGSDRAGSRWVDRAQRWSLVFSAVLGGCASVTGGSHQDVEVLALYAGTALPDAQCRLFNARGAWDGLSGSRLEVRRSADHLAATCTAPDGRMGLNVVESHGNPVAAGNYLIGGLAGLAVDAASGAAFMYPSRIEVSLSGPDELQRLIEGGRRRPVVGTLVTYEQTDGYTALKRRVARRVTHIDAQGLRFDEGGRVEPNGGEPVFTDRPVLGAMEAFEPPGGWCGRDVNAGSTQALVYDLRHMPGRVELDRARVTPTAAVTMTGLQDGQRWQRRGHVAAPGISGTIVSHSIVTSAWCPFGETRPVRFEIEVREVGIAGQSQLPVRETLVQVDMAPSEPVDAGEYTRSMRGRIEHEHQLQAFYRPGTRFRYLEQGSGTVRERRVSARVYGAVQFDGGERVVDLHQGWTVVQSPARLGLVESYEPPAGWLPAEPRVGYSERIRYGVQGGSGSASLRREVTDRRGVDTPAGHFDAWVVHAWGEVTMDHPGGPQVLGLDATVWIDAVTGLTVKSAVDVAANIRHDALTTGTSAHEHLELVAREDGPAAVTAGAPTLN